MDAQPEFLRKRVSEYVAEGLETGDGRVDLASEGSRIRKNLPEDKQGQLLQFGPLLIDMLFTEEVKKQTKSRPPPETEQVEAFPMDMWISAKKKGTRVRYRDATWEDHVAHREHQIANVRRVTRAFDREEERRDMLRDAGMADDFSMTTEQAVRRIQDGTDSLAAD